MATKRRPIHNPQPTTRMNFRPGGPETSRSEAKGTRPTAKPSSIKEVLVMMLLHLCKKSIFFDTNLKVALYLGSLFIISLIGDFAPFPKTYFSRSDNLFNVYFVKMSWAWTLIFSGPFLYMTSYTLCCGDTKKFFKNHLPRLLIATGFWYIWTKSFNLIESSYGRCNAKNLLTKSSCLKAGFLWYGFDISGHAFILIYSSLVMIEEAKPIINWDSIKEHIRNELHNRNISETTSTNPLRNLSEDEIKKLEYLYERYTPAIRTLFIGMTALQLLWDIMLVSTMLYYHKMIEKVIAGIIAILTWFFTYKAWYQTSYLPDSPGTGNFIYQKDNNKLENVTLKRKPSLTMPNTSATSSVSSSSSTFSGGRSGPGQVPRFMGMPIYNQNHSKYQQYQQYQEQQQQQQTSFATYTTGIGMNMNSATSNFMT